MELLTKSAVKPDIKNPDSGETPLLIAAKEGNAHIVQYLLDAGAAPDASDAEGLTALHAACYQGRFDVINLLLARLARTFCVLTPILRATSRLALPRPTAARTAALALQRHHC